VTMSEEIEMDILYDSTPWRLEYRPKVSPLQWQVYRVPKGPPDVSTLRTAVDDVNKDIDFKSNHKRLCHALEHLQSEGWQPTTKTTKVSKEFVRKARPLLYCDLATFERYCLYTKAIESAPDTAPMTDPDAISRIIAAGEYFAHLVRTYSLAGVEVSFLRNTIKTFIASENPKMPEDIQKYAEIFEVDLSTTKKILTSCIDLVAKTASFLAEKRKSAFKDEGNVNSGIPQSKYVACALGPSPQQNKGGIVFQLKPEVMHHPDFAIFFGRETAYKDKTIFFERPWDLLQTKQTDSAEPVMRGSDPNATYLHKVSNEQSLECHKSSCVHPAFENWTEVVAQQLINTTSLHVHKNIQDADEFHKEVGMGEFRDFLRQVDSKHAIHCRLPKKIPFEYIENIYLPATVWPYIRSFIGFVKVGSCDSNMSQLVSTVYKTRDDLRNKIDDLFYNSQVSRGIPKKGFTFCIAQMKGNDVFLPCGEFKREGYGWVRFKAKGQHIRITFTPKRENSRAADYKVYNIVIGAFKNSITYLKTLNKERKHLPEDPILHFKVSANENINAMASPYNHQMYWISIENGHVKAGKGSAINRQVFMDWEDKEDAVKFKHIGISTWETAIEFEQFEVGDIDEK